MMQPAFARSDRRYTSGEVLRSGAVAAHRSSNERAVNVMKRSGLLKRGLQKKAKHCYNRRCLACLGISSQFYVVASSLIFVL